MFLILIPMSVRMIVHYMSMRMVMFMDNVSIDRITQLNDCPPDLLKTYILCFVRDVYVRRIGSGLDGDGDDAGESLNGIVYSLRAMFARQI